MRAAFCGLLSLAIVCSAAAAPDENRLNQVRAAELNLIRGLVEQGVLTRDKAIELLRKGGIDPSLLDVPISAVGATPAEQAPAPSPQAPSAVATPSELLPESERKQIIEQVRQEVRAQAAAEGNANPALLPSWVQRISFGGDMRLRYQRNDFAADNADDAGGSTPIGLNTAKAIDAWYQLPPGTTQNALDSHEFLFLRARLNANAKVNETLKAGVQVVAVSGDDATVNPVDYDVALGRYGRPFSAAVSLAYLSWQPMPYWNVTGGRMINPYFRSDLIFSPDLSLDGVSVGYAPRLNDTWGAFINVGAHPLQTSQSGPFNSASEQWLYAAQTGATWRRFDASKLTVAAAYYDFSGIQGKPDALLPTNNTLNDASAPAFRQFGNTMFDLHYLWDVNSPLYAYAGQFRLVNFGAEFQYARFDPLRLALQLDWVRNVGFNPTQIEQRIGGAIAGLPYVLGPNGVQLNGVTYARTNGYLVNLRMGADELRHYGDWQFFVGERYLERDAVPDAFTSYEYRLGGTDNQSAYTGVRVALSPRTALTLRYISARSIDSGPKFGVDTWYLDFDGRF